MTLYNDISTYIFSNKIFSVLLVIFLLLTIDTPAYAKKDKTKKKSEYAVTLIEPDPICHKAKPDRLSNGPEAPNLAFMASGGKGTKLEGFDISHHNGTIDWRQLASDPHAGFVYLKMTEGGNIVDDTYKRNLIEARRNGIKVGSYHFFRPNVSASVQFSNFKRVFDSSNQDLVPMIDVETNPSSRAQLESTLESLLMMIEKEYGRMPIIYTGKNYYNKYFYGGRFAKKYKFWIAAYTDEQPVLNDNDDYLIWQYSPRGRARGVKGNIDCNKFVGRHVLNEIRY